MIFEGQLLLNEIGSRGEPEGEMKTQMKAKSLVRSEALVSDLLVEVEFILFIHNVELFFNSVIPVMKLEANLPRWPVPNRKPA